MLGEEVTQKNRVFLYGNIGTIQIDHVPLRLCVAQGFSSKLWNQTMRGTSSNGSHTVSYSGSILSKYEKLAGIVEAYGNITSSLNHRQPRICSQNNSLRPIDGYA